MPSARDGGFWSKLDCRISRWLEQNGVAVYVLAAVSMLAYGYEIFGFHLTIDEEIHASYSGFITEWLAQGRWGMSLLSFFMPAAVVPVVSPLLGVGLSVVAWWVLLRNVYGMDSPAATAATSLAVSVPVLAFTFTFSTLAYGIGVANLCLLAFAYCLRAEGGRTLALAALAGACAISIYQPFVIGLGALAIFGLLRSRDVPGRREVARATVALTAAVLVYSGIDRLARTAFRTGLQYVEGFIDVHGFVADPLHRLGAALARLVDVFALNADIFGLHSAWLGIAVLLAVLVNIRHALRSTGWVAVWRLSLLLGLLSLPVIADAVTPTGAPLRSSVYLPVVVALLVGAGIADGRAMPRVLLMAVVVFAVVANATITNRLFSSSAFAYELDKALVTEITAEANKQDIAKDVRQALRVEVVGYKEWRETSLMPKRETFGASFFEWEQGNRFRIALLLRLYGLPTEGAGSADRVRAIATAQSMPSWPTPGWIRVDDGVLILKFGGYTQRQRKELCDAGAPQFCADR